MLRELYNKAKAVDASLYTKESMTALQNAITQAEGVLQNDLATQAQVDAAYAALDAAYKGLVPVAGKDPGKDPATPGKSPDTGDHSNPMFILILILFASGAVFMLSLKKKADNTNH